MTSVNTNASATTALRTLQQTNKALDTTQNRISTGLKIGEAKDNAAYWAISTTLKSDNKSLGTVKDALGLGAATVDVAYQGLNKSKEVLEEIQKKLTAATQDGVDRTIIQSEINELKKQLTAIAGASSFSGENWLSVDSSALGYNADKELVSSFARAANNSVSIGTIKVDTSAMKLYDSAASSKGILDGQVALKKSDGTELTVGGTDTTTPAPSKQGLDAAVSVAGTVAGGATQAKVSLGTFNFVGIDVNDTLKFNISVDGAAAKSVSVKLDTSGLTSATPATSRAALATAMTNAFAAAGVTGATAAVDATTGEVTITSALSGAASGITVSGMAAVNGNGKTNTTPGSYFGLSNVAAAAVGAGTAATYTDTNYANGGNVAVGDKINFSFEYDGGIYDGSYTYTSATGGATESTFAALLQGAIGNSVLRSTINDPSPKTLGTGNIVVSGTDGSTDIVFTTSKTGSAQKVAILAVSATTTAGTTPANITKGLAAGGAVVVGTSTIATYALGTFADDTSNHGDTFSMNVTLGSDASGTQTAITKTVSFATPSTTAGGIDEFIANAQTAFDSQFGANKVLVFKNGTGVELKTVTGGAYESITVNALSTSDGNGSTSSLLGLTNATDAGSDTTTLAAGTATAASAFSTQTFGADDSVSFKIAVNGGAAKNVTINKASIDAALGAADNYTTGTGAITTSAQYLKVVQSALTNANVTGVSASLVSSGVDVGKLQFTSTTTGSGSNVVISNVTTTGASGADTMSVADIDLTSAKFTSLAAGDKKEVLTSYISVVNTAIKAVTTAASNLGSVASRIELQQSFVDTLMDTIDKGVGNLIDADLSEESTRLQALQTKQQLGVQALSIANSGTQQILRLFQ